MKWVQKAIFDSPLTGIHVRLVDFFSRVLLLNVILYTKIFYGSKCYSFSGNPQFEVQTIQLVAGVRKKRSE